MWLQLLKISLSGHGCMVYIKWRCDLQHKVCGLLGFQAASVVENVCRSLAFALSSCFPWGFVTFKDMKSPVAWKAKLRKEGRKAVPAPKRLKMWVCGYACSLCNKTVLVILCQLCVPRYVRTYMSFPRTQDLNAISMIR